MGWDDERAAIEGRLDDNWATTRVAWENVDFEPNPGETYVACRIVNADSDQVSLGDNPMHRNAGLISLAIMTPKGTGSSTVKGYADTLAAIFRGEQFSNITCRSPRVQEVGEAEGYYQVNVLIPFQRDEIF